MARVRLLGEESLLPEQGGWIPLELQEPVPMLRGDHYIVRLPSPPTTVGGGIVVNPNPGRKHRRFRPHVIERLETLAQGSPAGILLQTLEQEQPIPAGELVESGRLGDAAYRALDQLLGDGRVLHLGGADKQELLDAEQLVKGRKLVVSREWWSGLTDRMVNDLVSYHEEFPLRHGMPREALRSSLRLSPEAFDAVVARAQVEGLIVDEGTSVRLTSHSVELKPRQKQRVETLLSRFKANPYAPPSVKESLDMVGEDVFRVLIDRRDLVQVSPDVVFLPGTYREMVRRIRERIERQDGVTLGEVRDMFDSSRKYAQALLEHLDEVGVTRRLGDKRVLRGD
jgi:selenocysteine-specific elongation factor